MGKCGRRQRASSPIDRRWEMPSAWRISWACATGPAVDGPQILVPLEIRRRRADAGEVDPAIAVEVRRGAARGGHAAVVERRLRPPTVGSLREEPHAPRPATLSDNDVVEAAAVESGDDQRVTVHDRRVDHPALIVARRAAVIDRQLISVPRLDRGDEKGIATHVPSAAHRDVARSALWNG